MNENVALLISIKPGLSNRIQFKLAFAESACIYNALLVNHPSPALKPISVITSLIIVCSLLFTMSVRAGSSVIDLKQAAGIDQLVPKLKDHRVVLIGETHTEYAHHLNQLEIIRQLYAFNPELVIGLEFFQRPFQSVLDDYVEGRIDEKAFIRDSEYLKRWGFDYRLYRPIFDFARENQIPMIALNMDREITGLISQNGIESLSEEQKNRLPPDIDYSDQDYRDRLRSIFFEHAHASEEGFDNFIEVQLVWDETMAHRASEYLQAHPEASMVILAGSGHILYGSGIPRRLQRRLPDASLATIINLSEVSSVDSSMADYALLPDPVPLPPSGKLGVLIDTESNTVKVKEFVEDSHAHAAGLRRKDVITGIGDIDINDYYDLVLTLMNTEAGDTIEVEVERKRFFGGTKTIRFEVELVQ